MRWNLGWLTNINSERPKGCPPFRGCGPPARVLLWARLVFAVEGMGTRDLTTVLGRSWVSVKTMLFRARAKLMPYLAEWDEAGAARRPDGDERERKESPLGRMLRERRPAFPGDALLSPLSPTAGGLKGLP